MSKYDLGHLPSTPPDIAGFDAKCPACEDTGYLFGAALRLLGISPFLLSRPAPCLACNAGIRCTEYAVIDPRITAEMCQYAASEIRKQWDALTADRQKLMDNQRKSLAIINGLTHDLSNDNPNSRANPLQEKQSASGVGEGQAHDVAF